MTRPTRKLVLAIAGAAVGAFAAPSSARAGDAAAGKTVYETNCVSCHGPLGDGKGPVGAALNPSPRDFSKGEFKFDADGDGKPGGDPDLTNVIKNGAAQYGGSPLMAPWGHLSDKDIADVIAYVRTLRK
jgi:mono/diheme cytochrome c family protein